MSTPTNEPWTIRRIVRWSAEDFAKRGIDSPRLDAELLVAHALGVDRVRLYMDLERELSNDELGDIRALVQRRRKREPIAYLLGRREFWGRDFIVRPAVLIPRPDTETLVERALAILAGVDTKAGLDVVETQREHIAGVESHVVLDPVVSDVDPDEVNDVANANAEALDAAAPEVVAPEVVVPVSAASSAPVDRVRVLDLCTGTGAIGLTLACEVPWAEVTLTDVSFEALEVTRENLARWGERDASLASRVHVAQGDLFAAVSAEARFELITCNPPYLAEHELTECEADVRDHEPTLALVSGPRGDELLIRTIDGARRALAPSGTLLVEIGSSQGPRVRALFERAGFVDVRVHRDLGGRDRVVEGRWR